jgi:PKD repeat protein
VVDFDGSQSYDLEGQLQPKKWNWGDGSLNETGTTLTHRYLTVGNYSVKLTVTDMNGVSNFTVHPMAIKNLLRTPEPYFWLYLFPSADIGNVTSTFIFNSTSVDPDHVIEWFKWDFGDGTNATGPNNAHKYQRQGFYNVSLTIGWNGNQTATAWWHWLKVANIPPHAVAKVNGSLAFTTYKNEPLVFDASASIDPDDPVEVHTYRWYFDKADPLNTQDGTVVTHTYHRSGIYSVRLMVQEIVDDNIYADNATVLVTIKNRPPTANINCTNFTLEWNETAWVDAWRS